MNYLKYIIFTLLFISTQVSAATSSRLDLKLSTSFKYNKKLWGTYKQFAQKSELKEVGQKKIESDLLLPMGKMMIKNGHFVFVNPVLDQDKMIFTVNKFPYTKNGNEEYILKIPANDQSFEEIFRPQIHELVKAYFNKKDQNKELADLSNLYKLDIQSLACKKIKSIFHCNWKIHLNL